MAFDILYPDESNEQVKRHSSIDQFKGFVSAYKQGGLAPIIFDQLDGITCDSIKTHPVAISFDDIGFIYPESHCTFASDKFVYFDKEGVEQRVLPACMGGTGEFYDIYVRKNVFVNFDGPSDDGSSAGVHQTKTLRVGTDYCLASETLPSVE